MTEEIVKPEVKRNRGGRPSFPPAPTNATECRALIAAEVVRHKPRELTLRGLYRLLKEFSAAEKNPVELRKLEALEQANRQRQEELELKRQEAALRHAEYKRRFAGMPHGAQQLLRTVARLEQENAALRKQVADLVTELGRAA
jgi:hypothetical protein